MKGLQSTISNDRSAAPKSVGRLSPAHILDVFRLKADATADYCPYAHPLVVPQFAHL